MDLGEYLERYKSRISHDSERLFVTDFLYPVLGENIEYIIPQHPFVDRTGRRRSIDFAYTEGSRPIAFEINGESYHAEGIIPTEQFDDNLFRQNEIVARGFYVARFSYSQLQSPHWRPIVKDTVRNTLRQYASNLLLSAAVTPNELQLEALQALAFHRRRGGGKAVVIMPTGSGKTILSALDSRAVGGRTLFVVHRLDILTQTVEAFEYALGSINYGILTGIEKRNVAGCEFLFASKDTIRQTNTLLSFAPDEFNYLIVDEVHHGESPSYRPIFQYFQPKFMLGMTATPDRTDRKDILELFDYQKVYESSLVEAIERGLLVPYTYHGLTDDIDYSKIRYQSNRYRVDDLEKALIIPKRNETILREYLTRGDGDKGLGFCVSILHAERMADLFQSRGVSAVAIHSQRPDREQLIKDFTDNRYQIAFTVDLFNEGIDFPNLRVLLFLRPTESRTVFLQQLGRGLRLCTGKDRIIVLDFIGNYKRANQVRKYLAKSVIEEYSRSDQRSAKAVYEYATNCEVHFDATVEELLDRQDRLDRGVTNGDLIAAYYELAEKLERKPSRADLDSAGSYKSSQYVRNFGGWVAFLRGIGELTEASYHYPQGTHLGHVLAILWHFGLPSRAGTLFDDRFVRMSGGLALGQEGNYQRQLKYKLQACMELGLVTDVRKAGKDEGTLTLTPLGVRLRSALKPFLNADDLIFRPRQGESFGSTMPLREEEYNAIFRNAARASNEAARLIKQVFLGMDAVTQMLRYLYEVARTVTVQRSQIYTEFFNTPFVRQFCDRNGIEEATEEAAKRRCPFLLHILNAMGVSDADRTSVTVNKMLLTPDMVKTSYSESVAEAMRRLQAFETYWGEDNADMLAADLSVGRELYGVDFLSDKYHLKILETFGVKS